MRCSKAHKLINYYIDGEIKEADVELLKTHLRECEKCGNEMERLLNVSEAFEKIDRFKAPYAFSVRIMANIRAGKTINPPPVPLFIRVAEGLIVVVVILVGIISGGLISNRLLPDKSGIIMSPLSLEAFDPAPPYSLGGSYLAMTEAKK